MRWGHQGSRISRRWKLNFRQRPSGAPGELRSTVLVRLNGIPQHHLHLHVGGLPPFVRVGPTQVLDGVLYGPYDRHHPFQKNSRLSNAVDQLGLPDLRLRGVRNVHIVHFMGSSKRQINVECLDAMLKEQFENNLGLVVPRFGILNTPLLTCSGFND